MTQEVACRAIAKAELLFQLDLFMYVRPAVSPPVSSLLSTDAADNHDLLHWKSRKKPFTIVSAVCYVFFLFCGSRASLCRQETANSSS
jgi:hypothetical protein